MTTSGFSIPMKKRAAALWKEGATLRQIADALNDEFGTSFTKPMIYRLVDKHRSKFPNRSRAEMNSSISAGMVMKHAEKKVAKVESIYDGW